ncbi:hypothetical protein PROCH_1373 [Prochlorococcus marinus str. EQPAC1]|nr:hypothetical protein PROCH_1373 [Prochlorococcus marinus str. EQPAC1]
MFGAEMVTVLLIYDFSSFNFEDYLSKILIFASFALLSLITIAVIYISYISWKDKRRIEK